VILIKIAEIINTFLNAEEMLKKGFAIQINYELSEYEKEIDKITEENNQLKSELKKLHEGGKTNENHV
jgi:cell division protein FtsB